MPEKNTRAYYENRSDRAADIQASNGGNMNFPAHLHNDIELFLVQEGRVRVTVDDQTRELSAGGMAVVFPNTIHSYQTLTPQSRHLIVIAGAAFLGESYTRLTHSRAVCPFLEGEALHPDIPYAMEGLVRQVKTDPDPEIYRALLRLILARIFAGLPTEPAQEPISMDLAGSLVQYLAQNFERPLTLDILSRELGASKYHISHVFSHRLHTSFSDYVHFLRLAKAQELLSTTHMSMLEISLSCGFTSLRTFNRAFQKQLGLSPRQFRTRKNV